MDPKERVARGLENTGAAYIIPSVGGQLDNRVRDYQLQDKRRKYDEEKDVDTALRGLSVDLGKAWSNDFPELQEDYEKLVEKLKKYETSENKDQRRNLWYDIEHDKGMLKNKIYKSQSDKRNFINMATRVSTDKLGVYDYDEALVQMQDYQQKKVLDRGEMPEVTAATTQSFIDYAVKNTDYGPTKRRVKTVAADGTYKDTFVTEIDPVELKETLRTTVEGMPENKMNIAKRTLRNEIMAANPDYIHKTEAEKEKIVKDHIVDATYNAVYAGLEKKYGTIISNKSSNKIDWSLGGAAVTTPSGIYTVQKLDEDGTYKINIVDKGKGTPADNKPIDFQISGKEYKQITGDTTSPIADNDVMTIKGKLQYVKVNEDKNQIPMIGIQYDIAKGEQFSMVTDANGQVKFNFEPKFKQGQVFETVYRQENLPKILEYGADPIEVFYKKRKEADAIWEKDKKKTPELAKGKQNPYNKKETKSAFGEIPAQGTAPKVKPKSKGKLY